MVTVALNGHQRGSALVDPDSLFSTLRERDLMIRQVLRGVLPPTALLAAVLSATTAEAAAPCTPFDGPGEWRSCLDVSVHLAEAPALGREARLDIDLRTTLNRSDVQLDVSLPAGLEWVQTPAGLTSHTVASAAPTDRGRAHHATGTSHVVEDRPLRLTGRVRAVAEGAAQIQVVARAGVESDRGSAFLTVGAQRSQHGIAVSEGTTRAAATPTSAHPHLRHKPAGDVAATLGTACATGTWGYVDHDGIARISPNAKVWAYDDDTSGPDDLLATGLTDANGQFRLCYENTDEDGSGQDVYVRVATENAHWIIRNGRSRKSYSFYTDVVPNAGAAVEFGTVRPADPAMMRGVEAFDTMNAAWNWTPGACWDARDSTCRQGKINWAPDSTDGTYYSLQENAVHLAAEDPDSNILVLHEFGHAIMDDVYEDDFPPAPNCSPHYITKTSSTGCAWTEGFATWYGVAVLGDPTFRWPGGRTLDLEGPTWGTPNWDNGDAVEGRVLGAMIDLYDTANEPGDTCAENPAGPLWTTFLGHVSDTFRQFWAHRAADGYDVGPNALNCLYHNTIDY